MSPPKEDGPAREERPELGPTDSIHGGDTVRFVMLPVPAVACPDCRATMRDLHHDVTCPISRGLRAAQADDRAWFASRPHARQRIRPIVWAEIQHLRLAAVAGAHAVALDCVLRNVSMRVDRHGDELRRSVHRAEGS
jgi:hypothetical protein